MQHVGRAYLTFWLLTALLAAQVLRPADAPAPRAGTPDPYLGFIAAGADGNLWFPERRGIGRITPAGHIDHFALEQEPDYLIAPGLDGAIWFLLPGALAERAPDGHLRTYPLPPDVRRVGGIVVGPDQHLWLTMDMIGSGGRIGRLGASGEVATYPVPAKHSALGGIVTGPDGNLWFTDGIPDTIGRITPVGAITMYTLPEGGNGYYPNDIVAGSDGALWFTGTGGIGRITTSGQFSWHRVGPGLRWPWRIAAGPEGNLWATEIYGDHVWRITPAGKVHAFLVPTHNSGPWGITAGPDGNLWVTVTCANRLVRITPAGKMREFPVSDAHWDGSYCIEPV